MSSGIFDYKVIKPFESLGLIGPFWHVHIEILLATWLAMGIIAILALFARRHLRHEPTLVTVAVEHILSMFVDLCRTGPTTVDYRFFSFVTTIFFFTFFSSIVGLIPGVDEATRDINTTFALALSSFLYVQYHKIRAHGLKGYLKEFIDPFFILAPIHIAGDLSKIASMTFRLFGNVIGGSVIMMMVFQLIGNAKETFLIVYASVVVLAIINHLLHKLHSPNSVVAAVSNYSFFALSIISYLQIILGIGEGLIQSFVLAMLTATYLIIGTRHETNHGVGT